ncbi:hypothetical protein B0H10DRAFT_2134482 [Mycena sp. CBHHK59/15]|nr:hypothetical protein B0H10DRAFT_2134482 [Mycena sp. CBHHK59/15]
MRTAYGDAICNDIASPQTTNTPSSTSYYYPYSLPPPSNSYPTPHTPATLANNPYTGWTAPGFATPSQMSHNVTPLPYTPNPAPDPSSSPFPQNSTHDTSH